MVSPCQGRTTMDAALRAATTLGETHLELFAADVISAFADSLMSDAKQRMTASVKGFRMPAIHWREGPHGGRRPKSLEGGNRGGVRTGAGVNLWGICRGCLM